MSYMEEVGLNLHVYDVLHWEDLKRSDQGRLLVVYGILYEWRYIR